MTDRDALEQEMSLAIGYASPYRHASDTCAEVALRHIKAARAEALEECIYLADRTHPDDLVGAIRALMEPPV